MNKISSMASPSKVPRWTPSQSPKISLPNEPIKDYTDYASTVSEDEASFNKETYFPFSTASTTNVDLRTLPLYEVPSRAYPEEVKSHVDVEVVESRGGNSRTSTEKGVFLTWKDLCVTLAAQRNGRRAILQGLTGYAEPGEVLAIMGPSGCGKSTLLDALAGRLGSNTRQVGEILINGRRQALAFGTSFFASNGFPCPYLRNPSDHYLRTINKDFDSDIKQGIDGIMPAEEAINILVNSYKSSDTYYQIQQGVLEICQKKTGILDKKGNQASFVTQCLVLTRRSFVNMYRDLGYYWLRLAIYVALCLCVGTIFYDIGDSYGSIQARGSMLMFVAAFLTFMAIGGFPSFVEDMKIFGRERLNGHYGVAAFVVGNTISSIPYLLIISLLPGAIAYYLVGLQKGFEHFAFFCMLLFMCMMLVESLMMTVASIVPDFLMGIITGAGIQGVMMLNGGFFRLPNDLPKPFWRYPMYYIAFHKYANQGFYKNEFEGLTFPRDQSSGSSTISGEEILRNVWQVEMGYSKWIDIAILFGMVVLYRLVFLGIIKAVEKLKPVLRSFSFTAHNQPQ